jgi:histidine triad (HIT) family protein
MPIDRDCLFCQIMLKKIPADILYEDKHCAAFKDINPQAPHHILIIPKTHIETIHDVAADDDDYLLAMFEAARTLAEKFGLDKDGYRLVINKGEKAGQSVFHLHMHLLGGRSMQWPPG